MQNLWITFRLDNIDWTGGGAIDGRRALPPYHVGRIRLIRENFRENFSKNFPRDSAIRAPSGRWLTGGMPPTRKQGLTGYKIWCIDKGQEYYW
jgi:hypothetical protein